jgi:PhnB protein
MADPTGLIPHLVVSDANAAIDFYKKAFGAQEIMRHLAPDGKKIMHASLEVLGSRLMLNDDFPEFCGGKSSTPQALGGTPVTLHLHVSDARAVWDKAVAAGATINMPLKDQFWGDRYGVISDPFGHKWSIGQTISKPSAEEVAKAAEEAFKVPVH